MRELDAAIRAQLTETAGHLTPAAVGDLLDAPDPTDRAAAALHVVANYGGEKPADPLVLIRRMSDRQTYTAGAGAAQAPTTTRARFDLFTYHVEAIACGPSPAKALAIEQLLDPLMDDAPLDVDGWSLLDCRIVDRVEDQALVETSTAKGTLVWTRGLVIQVELQRA